MKVNTRIISGNYCDGTGTADCSSTVQCSCSHNPSTCTDRDAKACTHGNYGYHYYCTTHGLENSSSRTHCSHGYSSQH